VKCKLIIILISELEVTSEATYLIPDFYFPYMPGLINEDTTNTTPLSYDAEEGLAALVGNHSEIPQWLGWQQAEVEVKLTAEAEAGGGRRGDQCGGGQK
jgi:hypothetical protein